MSDLGRSLPIVLDRCGAVPPSAAAGRTLKDVSGRWLHFEAELRRLE